MVEVQWERNKECCVYLIGTGLFLYSQQTEKRDKIMIISRETQMHSFMYEYTFGDPLSLCWYTRVVKWSFADIGELENRLLGWKKIIIIRAYFNYNKKLHCSYYIRYDRPTFRHILFNQLLLSHNFFALQAIVGSINSYQCVYVITHKIMYSRVHWIMMVIIVFLWTADIHPTCKSLFLQGTNWAVVEVIKYSINGQCLLLFSDTIPTLTWVYILQTVKIILQRTGKNHLAWL